VDVGGDTLVRVSEVNLPNLDQTRVQAASEFHNEIRTAQKKNTSFEAYSASGPKVRPVVGIEQPTFQSAKFDGTTVTMMKAHEGKDLKGDGTVPRVSAIPIELSSEAATYVATTHSALHSDDGAIGHLRGVLTEGDLDLGKYRQVSMGTIGLSVADAYASNVPFEIVAKPSDYVQGIHADISRLDQQMPIISKMLRPSGDQYAASLSLPEGLYCVSLKPKDFQHVSDVFLVVDA
jgi:hypothetical protein